MRAGEGRLSRISVQQSLMMFSVVVLSPRRLLNSRQVRAGDLLACRRHLKDCPTAREAELSDQSFLWQCRRHLKDCPTAREADLSYQSFLWQCGITLIVYLEGSVMTWNIMKHPTFRSIQHFALSILLQEASSIPNQASFFKKHP